MKDAILNDVVLRDDGGAFIMRGDLPSWSRCGDRRFWFLHSCFWGSSRAVQDDFGNLVRVGA